MSEKLLSISDDDLCSACRHCNYNPGEMSGCRKGWPAVFDADGYAKECAEFELSHTPTPWIVREQGEANQWALMTADGGWLIVPLLHNGEALDERQRANLDFIARAVNAHDALVSVVQRLVTMVEELKGATQGGFYVLAKNEGRAALKLAGVSHV